MKNPQVKVDDGDTQKEPGRAAFYADLAEADAHNATIDAGAESAMDERDLARQVNYPLFLGLAGSVSANVLAVFGFMMRRSQWKLDFHLKKLEIAAKEAELTEKGVTVPN